ncbi:NADH-quinone oxidoreductase subunit G [Campylobacter curvus]|uniref:NADH-quinone oxidoreductase subunit G n=1 Tax=Campylobacter curvus TaxID=200 RepID=UPI00146FED84|nr:NADH-quinone oxidoreductase subunit G [Campylobacter curvus]
MRLSINGQICEASEGEYILNVARREGIFIPALCYLSGCSPTLACRLCMVEADGKRVYSCNAKAKEGMSVITNTTEIAAEREAIMQTYCVNHPLQCGVCDKSGECELQNFAARMRVNSQKFAIKDSHKPHKKWGLINYDPALCIVCERCITVCKDKIGESALKTTPRGADQVAKELKESMPKDAFAVWSKFQKSLIAPSAGEVLECSFCGECTSVCPVGALVSSDFQYTSNVWELEKIPAANPHSSDCELIYYEVKPKGIGDRTKRIYRVNNEFHFGEINTAARYGFDFHNENAAKNEVKFEEIVRAFKQGEIRNIKFNSFITNEEALILERLREKFSLNLINEEALAYARFLEEFSKFSGTSLYNGSFENITKADFIVVAGSFLRYDSPNTGYKVNNALVMNKAGGLYFHPLGDEIVRSYSKNFDVIAHEPGAEGKILLLLLQKFAKNLPAKLAEFSPSDLASELGVDESRLEALSANKQNSVLILGEDLYLSPHAKELAALAGAIQRYTDFKLILIPPRTNSLGVAKICTLSNQPKSGKTLGYNEEGDFKFSVFEGDIDAGALNQQEGTFTSINKAVVPTNAALAHEGYFLNDLANALGLSARYTIDYTHELPKSGGFKAVKFDDLKNFYDNDGKAHRGYELENLSILTKDDLDISNFKAFSCKKAEILQDDGEICIYRANPIRHFSKFTNRTKLLNEVGALYASAEFLAKFKLDQNDAAIIKKGEDEIAILVKLDKDLSGEWAYLGDFDEKIRTDEIFKGARFANVQILRSKEASDE